MSSDSNGQLAQSTNRQVLWLIVGAALFVVAMIAVLAYVVSRPQTADIEAAERDAIQQCRRRSQDPTAPGTSRSFQEEACREMEKQFQKKFGRAP